MTMLNDFDITVMGDSIAKGLFLKDNKIMRIERNTVKLMQEHYGVSIENFSLFGQTLKKTVQKGFFDTYLENNAHKPNKVLVIALGGNDCDYNWKEVGEHPNAQHEPNTPPSEFFSLLNENVQKLKKGGIHTYLAALPPVYSDRYFQNIIAARADKDAVLHFFTGDVTNISRHQECYNNLILRAALLNRCPFIDFRTDFLLKNNMPDYISEDGIHPNEMGHELMFRRIQEFTEQSLPLYA